MVTMAPPGTGLQVRFENESFNGIRPSQEEADLLELQLDHYIAPQNAFLRELFKDNLDNIKAALAVAKAEIGGPFRGMFAGDAEIGLSLIRPNHLLRSTAATETNTNTWTRTLTVGDDYIVGFGTDNTTAINVDKRLLIVPLGVWWTGGSSPITEELLITVGGTTYPVQVVRHGWVADNPSQIRAARIRPILMKPKSTAIVRGYQIAAGDQQMVFVGVAFAKGDLLRLQAPTTVQT